mgnify:CR=1 FL=1
MLIFSFILNIIYKFIHQNILLLVIASYLFAALLPEMGSWMRNYSLGDLKIINHQIHLSLSAVMLAILLFNAGLGIKSGEGAIMQREQDAFAQSVIDLLSSAEMRRSVGNAGMKVIQTRFDWDIIATQLEGYFKEVTPNP